jgi:hypothetical protein
MKVKVLLLTGIVVITAAAFILFSGNDNSATDETEAQEVKELVAEYSAGNISDASASITSHELIVTETDNDKNQFTYNLPEDEFFVSIAPYETQTHP